MLLAIRYPSAPDAAMFGQLTEDGSCRLWVGGLNDSVLGFAAARAVTLDSGSVLAGLDVLYVLPEARGVGLGEALMDEVLRWAGEEGACGVDSLALPGDRATKNFFERYGLVARALQVHRPLADLRGHPGAGAT